MTPCFYTLDPASLLITSHYHDGLPEIPQAWLALEYYDDDVNKLAELPDGDWDTHAKLPPSVLAVAGRALRTAAAADSLGEIAFARVLSRSGRWISCTEPRSCPMAAVAWP